MNIRLLIFTTSKETWFSRDLSALTINLERATGVTIEAIDVRHIDLESVALRTDQDGDVKFDWDWFRLHFTSKAPGYNAVMLHITREEKARHGITVNGTYRADSDEIFECWISADKGQKATHYHMSEWLRLAIHELGGHGFERFVYGYESNLTHLYDYHLKQLPYVTGLMDFTEWNRLAQKRDGLLQRLYQLLLNKMNRPTYPLPEEYFTKNRISQAFGVRNPHYASGVHGGTDFLCPIGTPVYAPQDGTITVNGQDHPTLGDYVYYSCVIDGKRYWMRFLHLSKAMPTGNYTRGQLIGYTGNSGDSTGPHLHLDLWNRSIDASKIRTPGGVKAYLLDPHAFFKEKVDGIMGE